MNLELLKAMLEKAYRIEASFESEANFKAFIEVMEEEQKKVLLKLMKDSERHRIIIERLSKDLGLEIEKKPENFSFSNKRFFNEIYRIETSAKALYENIISNFAEILGEKVKVLKEIAMDEEMHAKLVEKYLDKTLRIL